MIVEMVLKYDTHDKPYHLALHMEELPKQGDFIDCEGMMFKVEDRIFEIDNTLSVNYIVVAKQEHR